MRGMRLLFPAGLSSNLADGIFWSFIPLYAAFTLNDPGFLGLTLALKTVMFSGIGLLLPAFLVARPSIFLRGTAFVRALLIGVVTAAFVATEHPGLLILLVITNALFEIQVDSTSQALVPSIVPRAALPSQNQRLQVWGTLVNEALAPNITALLFAGIAALTLTVASTAYGIAALLYARLAAFLAFSQRQPDQGLLPAKTPFGAYLSFYRRSPNIRLLLLLSVLISVTAGVTGTALPFVIKNNTDLSPALFGLFPVFFALGSMVSLSLRRFRPTALTEARSTLLIACSCLAMSSLVAGALPTVLALFLAQALAGFGFSMWLMVEITVRQVESPPLLLIGSIGIFRAVEAASFAVGALLPQSLRLTQSDFEPVLLLVGGAQVMVVVFIAVNRTLTRISLRDEGTT